MDKCESMHGFIPAIELYGEKKYIYIYIVYCIFSYYIIIVNLCKLQLFENIINEKEIIRL